MRPPQLDALLARYHSDDTAAFFAMVFDDGGGIRWPPARGQRIRTLRRCIRHLRVCHVNDQYCNIYSVPPDQSPVGGRMPDLTGSVASAASVLTDFYDSGGFSRVMTVRARWDGHLMALRGEYRVLRLDDHIVGHYGVEVDITAQTVRPPGGAFH